MAQIRFYKLTALPASPQPNAVYFIQDGSKFDLYVTDTSGAAFPLDAGSASDVGEVPAINISYGDATPSTIYTPGVNQIITSVTVVVETVFNGVGAKISVGTSGDPELLVAEDDTDITTLAVYELDPEIEVALGTPIQVFITPGAGASQGNCMILIEYAEA